MSGCLARLSLPLSVLVAPLLIGIRNGSERAKVTGKRLKALGLSALGDLLSDDVARGNLNTMSAIHNMVNNKRDHVSRVNRGIEAETLVLEMLRKAGRTVEKQLHGCAFDLLVDGWRVDVKTAIPSVATGRQRWNGDRWLFNLHHNTVPITECDFFLLRMLSAPKQNDGVLHLLLRAPFHSISYAVYGARPSSYMAGAELFDIFLRGKYGIGPHSSLKTERVLPEFNNA